MHDVSRPRPHEGLRYHIGGLSVASDIVLPGARLVASDAPPDVSILRGDVPETLEAPTIVMKRWCADATNLLARVIKGRFLVSDGRTIRYAPEPGFAPEDCAPFLVGSVFGFLMHQRGGVVLHASAVSVDGRAMLFCGPSGMGKSTMAAAFCQRGRALLADDFCVVGFDAAGAPLVHSDARMHRLTEASVEALKPARIGSRIPHFTSKFYVEPAIAEPPGTVPVGCVYVLERGDVPAIGALNAAEASFLLGRNAYRPMVVRRMGQTKLYLDAATAILRHASVRRLTLSGRMESLDSAIALIERDFAAIRD